MLTRGGFYVYLSCKSQEVASDMFGPFDSEEDIQNWLREYRVEYRQDGKTFGHVPYCGEMTDQVAGPIWATGTHRR